MRTGTRLEDGTSSISTMEFGLYLFNGHGDVTGITDKDGNVEKTYDYDAI